MEYDEIDQYVDQLFRDQDQGSAKEVLHGEVLSGDWRIDPIDDIIQDAYEEAMWWHNNRISEGSDPRSGLQNLPYVPWDERIDGVTAMQGAIGSINEGSFEQNGGAWNINGGQSSVYEEVYERGVSCAEFALIFVVAVALLLFMIVSS